MCITSSLLLGVLVAVLTGLSKSPVPGAGLLATPLLAGAVGGRGLLRGDTSGASRRLHILAINDDTCRENLCLLGDTRISGVRVARELDTLVRLYGKPACIVNDNETEFTSRAILKWPTRTSDPGKPQQKRRA